MKLHSVATVNIAGILNSKKKEQKVQRQHMLLKLLSALRFLARQGLASQSHEESEGNMIQLLHMWSTHDANLKEWLREGNYLSHQIVNQQIKLMTDQVLRHLLSEIRAASILADEASNVACNEQMNITIRWVSDQ